MSAESISAALISAGIPVELVIVIISAIPIIELRGSIPFGVNLMGMPWYTVFPLAIIGNLLPVPFLLLFTEFISKELSRIPVFEKFFTWLFKKTREKSGAIAQYKHTGLALFVAIPLPGTGAWTGSIAAVLLSMDRKWAVISVTAGVLIAAVIVTMLCLLGWVGAIIAGVALSIVLAYGFRHSAR